MLKSISELFASFSYASICGLVAFAVLYKEPVKEIPVFQTNILANAAILDPQYLIKGSVSHLGNGIWLTAKHVVGDNSITVIADSAGDLHEAKQILGSELSDTAILISETYPKERYEIDCSVKEVGTEIVAVGSPSRAFNVSVFGRIASKPRKTSLTSVTYFVSMPGAPGISGAPVLHRGKIVGIYTGILLGHVGGGVFPITSGIGIVTASPSICQLLEAP